MKDSLHNYIEPGIVHFMAYPVIKGMGPVVETLEKLLADDFFDLIEISWFKDPTEREQARKLLYGSGINIKYGAQPRLLTQKLDVNSLDDATRQAAINEMKAAIDDAADLCIRDFGLLSGPYPGDDKKAAAMDALESSLVDICKYAGDKGMSVALEVFDRSIDKKCLIGPAADAKEIAERVKTEVWNFGLMVDLSHIPLLGETPAEALQPVKDHLAHIHIGNCYMEDTSDPAYGDHHPHFGYPGGANDVPEIVAFLKELFAVGYLAADGSRRGAVSFELKPVGEENPEVMIANGKRKLLEAWRQLSL